MILEVNKMPKYIFAVAISYLLFSSSCSNLEKEESVPWQTLADSLKLDQGICEVLENWHKDSLGCLSLRREGLMTILELVPIGSTHYYISHLLGKPEHTSEMPDESFEEHGLYYLCEYTVTSSCKESENGVKVIGPEMSLVLIFSHQTDQLVQSHMRMI